MLEIENLSYRYSGTDLPLLQNINMTIDTGELVLITGSSGSGKSTLGKLISGYLLHQMKGDIQGTIIKDGESIAGYDVASISQEIFLVHQNPQSQFCTLTVKDEIVFGLENYGFPPAEISIRLHWALDAVLANDLIDRDLRTLSGGEQQKVAIATALALKPDVIILDEPTSNLDLISTDHIMSALTKLRIENRTTVIVFEHKFKNLLLLRPTMYQIAAGEIRGISLKNTPNLRKNYPIRKKKRKEKDQKIIQLEEVIVRKEEREILRLNHLDIASGQFLSLLGNNGAGKTTLLLAIAGLIDFSASVQRVCGRNQQGKRARRYLGDIGMVFQNPDHQFFTDSVRSEIQFPIDAFQKTDIPSTWIRKLTEDFNLREIAACHPLKLSYGQKRRLSIASVLSFQPRLLLLDEVFIGQPDKEISRLLKLLRSYVDDQMATIILVNHYPEIVAKYVDRTIVLEHGQIVYDEGENLSLVTINRLLNAEGINEP